MFMFPWIGSFPLGVGSTRPPKECQRLRLVDEKEPPKTGVHSGKERKSQKRDTLNVPDLIYLVS